MRTSRASKGQRRLRSTHGPWQWPGSGRPLERSSPSIPPRCLDALQTGRAAAAAAAAAEGAKDAMERWRHRQGHPPLQPPAPVARILQKRTKRCGASGFSALSDTWRSASRGRRRGLTRQPCALASWRTRHVWLRCRCRLPSGHLLSSGALRPQVILPPSPPSPMAA